MIIFGIDLDFCGFVFGVNRHGVGLELKLPRNRQLYIETWGDLDNIIDMATPNGLREPEFAAKKFGVRLYYKGRGDRAPWSWLSVPSSASAYGG